MDQQKEKQQSLSVNKSLIYRLGGRTTSSALLNKVSGEGCNE